MYSAFAGYLLRTSQGHKRIQHQLVTNTRAERTSAGAAGMQAVQALAEQAVQVAAQVHLRAVALQHPAKRHRPRARRLPACFRLRSGASGGRRRRRRVRQPPGPRVRVRDDAERVVAVCDDGRRALLLPAQGLKRGDSAVQMPRTSWCVCTRGGLRRQTASPECGLCQQDVLCRWESLEC